MSVLDILLVTFLIYRLLKMVRGTRAWKVLIGIIVFVAALVISEKLGLQTLHWILEKATVLAPVAVVILLLPELRQALEGFAKLGLWPERFISGGQSVEEQVIDELVQATEQMSKEKIGALIVIERGESLDHIARNGVPVNAQVTAPLVGAIFYHGNPLHDGAALIRKDKLISAACRLPLSENPSLDSHLHMRHRAGVGMTEQSDCISLIVSEERGQISVSVGGNLKRMKDAEALKVELTDLLGENSEGGGVGRVFRRRNANSADDQSSSQEEQAS